MILGGERVHQTYPELQALDNTFVLLMKKVWNVVIIMKKMFNEHLLELQNNVVKTMKTNKKAIAKTHQATEQVQESGQQQDIFCLHYPHRLSQSLNAPSPPSTGQLITQKTYSLSST